MRRRNRETARDRKLDALSGSNCWLEMPAPCVTSEDDRKLPQRIDTPIASSISTQGTIHRSLIQEDSHIFLLQQLYAEPRQPEDDEVRRYVKDLGLAFASRPDQAERIEWNVEKGSLSKLRLPNREKHSGAFEWIGQEKDKYPTYLWDSCEDNTVLAVPARLEEGYIAVSWTWGRYQKHQNGQPVFRKSNTVPWELPVIPAEGRQPDLIRALKDCLKKIRGYRYFWVDVLCLHQQKEDEKRHEIEKQAGIFGGAEGVLCFLWNLDQPSHLVDPLEGLGELLGWALNFERRETGKKSVDSWTDSFERLRDENWFSSLWALQEIVLAPAGVWMTRTGDICYVNNQILTTKLMATILRLLCWADRKRAEIWQLAEHDFVKTAGISRKQLAKFKGQRRARQIETRRAIKEVIKAQNELATSYGNQSFASGPLHNPLLSLFSRHTGSAEDHEQTLFADILRNGAYEEAPWTVYRQDDEESLRKQIRSWTHWAFGTACIDVSLSTTRAAIIIAATNRSIVPGNSREPALLAALKVEPSDQLLRHTFPTRHAGNDCKHLSPLLMNVILAKEGLGLFNVAHGMPQRSLKHIASDDFVLINFPPTDDTIDIIRVEDENFGPHIHSRSSWWHITRRQTRLSDIVLYQQRGEDKPTHKLPSDGSALSDMSPDTAWAMNLQVLPFDSGKLYQWLPSQNWHIHYDGGLHVPFGARIQTVRKPRRRDREKLAALVQLNGCESDPHAIYSPEDLNIICNTQDWLLQLLGTKSGKLKAWFLFLPLGFHQQAVPGQTEGCSIESIDDVTITKSHSIGILLVANANSSKGQSMTYWHKLGTYEGTTEMEDSTLDWKDGIVVTSHGGENRIQIGQPDHCTSVEKQLKQFFGQLDESQRCMKSLIARSKILNRIGTEFVGKTIPKEVPWKRKFIKMIASPRRLLEVNNFWSY